MLLIHWPTLQDDSSSDPSCQASKSTYDETTCRLNTWQAMLEIYSSGQARAIGVSNYNISHLQEIINAGLPLPSVNQCPFHLYRSSTQEALRQFCNANNILFNGYSPLGIPDWHIFPGPYLAKTPITDLAVAQVASAHNVTAAQVLIQWQYALGVAVQPRSQNLNHMDENLRSYDFSLTNTEIDLLNSAPQVYCTVDPVFYECAPAPILE